MKFVRKNGYYRGIVHEFNLPTGHTCPFAETCLVKVNKETGKFTNKSTDYFCYASKPERFPAVRNHRWENLEAVRGKEVFTLPSKIKHLRIHASGDFFSQSYFDAWLETAYRNPDVEIWAYTKSLKFWVKRVNDIPKNFILTASYGGRTDELINLYGLKNVKVVKSVEEAKAMNRPIDVNDDYARIPHINFALLDNTIVGKQKQAGQNE